MEAGVHLPQVPFGDELPSLAGLVGVVDTARECGFAAVSANDHFVFPAPWLDGPTALAAVLEHTGTMTLATTLSLPVLRGPAPLAKALGGLQLLSGGRLVAGVGPGSSAADHVAAGAAYDDRWRRFDESVPRLRAALHDDPLVTTPVPLWIGSWGSRAGLRRVARLGDGWLASAYNTTPAEFAAGRGVLREELAAQGRPEVALPNALVTMWTWVTEDDAEAERVLAHRVAPLVRRDPDTLRGRLCVGSARQCAELLAAYADSGCARVHFWPVGDERRQLELLADRVLPQVRPGPRPAAPPSP